MPNQNINNVITMLAGRAHVTDDHIEPVFNYLAPKQYGMSDEEVKALIKVSTFWFRESCIRAEFPEDKVKALTTKFRDAGRRSAPWKPASSKVPGRPQDGGDGNRISRWLMDPNHKYYANELDATLVEVKYMLQAMSMLGAPNPIFPVGNLFTPWLVEHPVSPDEYRDPVQIIPISFNEVLNDPRTIQSGHLIPLDRGGKHHPDNTFLMIARSNQLQGNMKVAELLELMEQIVKRHAELRRDGNRLEQLIRN